MLDRCWIYLICDWVVFFWVCFGWFWVLSWVMVGWVGVLFLLDWWLFCLFVWVWRLVVCWDLGLWVVRWGGWWWGVGWKVFVECWWDWLLRCCWCWYCWWYWFFWSVGVSCYKVCDWCLFFVGRCCIECCGGGGWDS